AAARDAGAVADSRTVARDGRAAAARLRSSGRRAGHVVGDARGCRPLIASPHAGLPPAAVDARPLARRAACARARVVGGRRAARLCAPPRAAPRGWVLARGWGRGPRRAPPSGPWATAPRLWARVHGLYDG